MRKLITRVLCAVLTAALLLPLSSCGRSEVRKKQAQGETLKVYYLNDTVTSLQAESYRPKASRKQTQARIKELGKVLAKQPEDVSERAPISDFSLEGSQLDNDGLLTLDFSREYRQMDQITELLTRAAIVSTMCGVDGVKAVAFTIEGEELRDASDNPVGSMTRSKFIYNSGEEILSYSRERFRLYFATENGKKLRVSIRQVTYNSSVSKERAVVEELVKGSSSSSGDLSTINPQTKILGVTSRDGVCYVNFDEGFLTNPNNVAPEVAIYSLVNSLTEIPEINAVQIMVNGSSDVEFMKSIDLSKPLKRKTSLISSKSGQSGSSATSAAAKEE